MATLPQTPGQEWPKGLTPRYRLFRNTVLLLCRILLGLSLHGEKNAPERGPLVLAANHFRYMDPIFVCVAVPRRVQWMAKKEIFLPGLRRFFALLGAFPVDREGGGRAALKNAINLLSQGWALGIFPEGTHKQGGGERDAKSGVSMLAVRGRARVVPIHLGKIPTPLARLRGDRFHVRVGSPIDIDNTLKGREAYKEAAERVLRTIYSLPEQESERQRV
jgi:1-acyl-sn-glycerol-3-phosphate acyltransferase